MAANGGVRYVVLTWVPEEMLEEWNHWHNRVHIPHVLAAPQMRGVRKFRIADVALPEGWRPQYATVYQLDSLADFEAYRDGPGVAMRQEYEARYGDVGKTARIVLGEEFRIDAR
jgi:hypothetical protein